VVVIFTLIEYIFNSGRFIANELSKLG